MPAPRLHLPRGLPGSGKSTVARRLASQGAVHVELDAFKRRLWSATGRIWIRGLRPASACWPRTPGSWSTTSGTWTSKRALPATLPGPIR